ncbi:hypothetical protein JCGZ_00053 [Jatropha curcas]|uniref:Uncharacterized protein n=1 Tax=Jatropha curcas TaxID=180498 RepID=A0A067LFH9_JATCU|nr:hypothetical protein JCGZ_00053 [Jatropha curcas]
MARGRAVDSNAFGSGPCGGHGRGRSTRGRGGTIPPSSSSGMSTASSSAQSPMPPPLPSIPSSSTPFLGPAKSSLASQIPTAPASRQIMRIIKLHQDKDGYTWDAVQQKKHFVWEEAITAMLKVAWEKLCALWYTDFTNRM